MNVADLLTNYLGKNVNPGAKVQGIVSGMGCGLVLLIVALGITYFSVTGVKEESGIVANLSLKNAESVTEDERGLVELYGQLVTSNPVSVTVDKCFDRFCDMVGEQTDFSDLLYNKVVYERYEVVREVKKEEREEGRREVKETVEYKEEWVEKDKLEDWADIQMAGIDIKAEDARALIEFNSVEIDDVFLAGLGPVETYGQRTSASIGQVRAKVTYLPADDREYIVAGELRTDGLRGGEVFILTDKGHDELVGSLEASESFMRWALRFVAWLFLTIGFTNFLAPILALTDFIPLVGKAARTAATVASAILAAVIVLTTVLFLNYWWVFLIGAIVLVVIVAVLFISWYNRRQGKEAK